MQICRTQDLLILTNHSFPRHSLYKSAPNWHQWGRRFLTNSSRLKIFTLTRTFLPQILPAHPQAQLPCRPPPHPCHPFPCTEHHANLYRLHNANIKNEFFDAYTALLPPVLKQLLFSAQTQNLKIETGILKRGKQKLLIKRASWAMLLGMYYTIIFALHLLY